MADAPTALIAFVSLTGNTEEIATRLSEELTKLGVASSVEDMMVISASDFLEKDICVVASYSFDSGDETVPEEAMDFFEDLGKLDLTGKVFGTLGSGQNDIYEHFCGSVDRFESQFLKTGAKEGTSSLKIDWNLSTDEDENSLVTFAKNLVEATKNK